MALYGDAHFWIRHGESSGWGVQARQGSRLLHLVGDASARVSKKHPVIVEFGDPQQRNPAHTVAVLRRLRRFMEQNGFVELSSDQTEFGARVTFAGKGAAKKLAPAPPATPRPEAPQLPQVKLTDSPGAAKPDGISNLESKFEIQLPADYRAFLAQYNGGVPAAGNLDTGEADVGVITIDRFLSVTDSPGAFHENDLGSNIEFQWGSLDLPEDFIPIARADEDIILLCVKGSNAGRVRLWRDIEGGYEEENTLSLAGSFAELLERLSDRATE
ncbi:MAG: SMI1/KNR4 family protein [Planctomycetes bacterium]|nr:SMI1/KNR4 family protein [Planctomycetota bacterium]